MLEATPTGSIQESTAVAPETVSSTDKTADGTQNVETTEGKLFTQEELNNIIKKRLDKFSDYEELQQYKQTAEQEKLTEVEKLQKQIEELTPYKNQVESANNILEQMLNNELEAIAEDKRGLIPQKFTTSEKLEYITQNKQFLHSGKMNIKTPSDGNTPSETDSNLIFGKYTSQAEFAEKNPSEFKKVYSTREYQAELKRLGII